MWLKEVEEKMFSERFGLIMDALILIFDFNFDRADNCHIIADNR